MRGDANIIWQTEETVRRGKKIHTHFIETGDIIEGTDKD